MPANFGDYLNWCSLKSIELERRLGLMDFNNGIESTEEIIARSSLNLELEIVLAASSCGPSDNMTKLSKHLPKYLSFH